MEAVMVLRKKMKMRTVHGQIFTGKMDVYECPKPYVIILNISTDHEHTVRMDVHKQDLSREMRLWLEGKQIHNPLIVVPDRINDVMSRFVKFGKPPLQEDLIMWVASRAELSWAPEAECLFGGFPVPDPDLIAQEARLAAVAAQKAKDERDFNNTNFSTAFQKSAAFAQVSQSYGDDAVRLNDTKLANNGELKNAIHGPEFDDSPSSPPRHQRALTPKQMADLRQSNEQHRPINTHLLARELLGKSPALGALKSHKTKGREGSKISVVTPQLSGEHYRLGCEIERARKDVTEAMDRRRRMIEIAKTRQKQSADHYREIREKAKITSEGWVRTAMEELMTLNKIKEDIEDDVRKQKNIVQRAQQKVMWTMVPPGNMNRAGKSKPGVLIGPGPLPPQALYAQEDPVIESTIKHHYWDTHGRRHARPQSAEFNDQDTAEIVHHALEALRKAGKTLQAEKLDLKAVFSEFDKNGDGYLTVEEIASALISLGVRLNSASILALFSHFDPNHSGSVHYGEFLWGFFNRRELARKWKRNTSRMQPKEIRAKFHEADKNGDGSLSRSEFKKFLKSFAIDATAQEVDVMLYRFDLDGNGELNLGEFQAFMENEIHVLTNVDALKGEVSPILAQSRKAVERAMHPSPPSAISHSHQHHKVEKLHTCTCSQFALHRTCAHVNPELAEVADDEDVLDPVFATSALQAQATIEAQLGARVFKKSQPHSAH